VRDEDAVLGIELLATGVVGKGGVLRGSQVEVYLGRCEGARSGRGVGGGSFCMGEVERGEGVW